MIVISEFFTSIDEKDIIGFVSEESNVVYVKVNISAT